MDKLIDQDTLIKAAQNIVNLFYCKEDQGQDSETSIVDAAAKAKIAETTIRNAKNGKLKSISYEKVAILANNLLGVSAYDPKRMRDIAELDSGENKEDFLRKFDHLFSYDTIDLELEKHLDSFEKMKIFWSAYSCSHITREAILQKMGEDGQSALDELIETGLVVEDNNIIKGRVKMCMIPLQVAQKMAQMCLANFSHERNRKEGNWLSHQTESVNEKFIKYWRSRSKDFFKEFCETSQLPQFQGDTQFYFLQSTDVHLEGESDFSKGSITQ